VAAASPVRAHRPSDPSAQPAAQQSPSTPIWLNRAVSRPTLHARTRRPRSRR